MNKWVQAVLVVGVWGGVGTGLAFTTVRGPESVRTVHGTSGAPKPTIQVVPDVVSSGDIVSLHIQVPVRADGNPVHLGKWTYGYIAAFEQSLGSAWRHRYTLFVAVEEPPGEFSDTGYTSKKYPVVDSIGFVGSREASIKIPPVEPGRYRVAMDFGDRTRAHGVVDVRLTR